jgi:TonB family protein
MPSPRLAEEIEHGGEMLLRIRTGPRALGRVAAAAGVAAVFAACATSGSPRNGSACVSDRAPHEASIEEVVDSTTLAAALEEFWAGGAGLTLAIVSYDSVGALGGVNTISAVHTGAERRRIAEVVQDLSTVDGEPDSRVQLVLGDSRGPAPYRVRELRSCAPEMLNRDFIAERFREESRRLQRPINVQVLVAVEVQRDARVSDVRLMRGTGDFDADSIAVSVARETTWRPAMWEGIPVGPVWGQFPVTFRSARR